MANYINDKVVYTKDLKPGDLILFNNNKFINFLIPGNFKHVSIILGSISNVLETYRFLLLYENNKLTEEINDNIKKLFHGFLINYNDCLVTLQVDSKNKENKKKWKLDSMSNVLKNANKFIIIRHNDHYVIDEKKLILSIFDYLDKYYGVRNYKNDYSDNNFKYCFQIIFEILKENIPSYKKKYLNYKDIILSKVFINKQFKKVL